jgi:hypothetical protein
MTLIEHGRVQEGKIVFAEPLKLPEGAEVVVRIEVIANGMREELAEEESDFETLPFFGMWADREEMRDSSLWVRQLREQWRERTSWQG